MSRLLISAAHKSSGKTTISIGLCAALRAKGHVVQPFKKGPDYIDPLWLSQAAGRPCHNLDFYLQDDAEIVAACARQMRGADIAIIEGNKGLYDGLNLDGSNSNAALARLLHAPVILVIDARGMTRGVAPLILGYQAFDREINIAGVILNNLGGRRHESKLRAVIEHYTRVPVIGAVQHSADLEIVERHLGLIPSNEVSQSTRRIAAIAEQVAAQVDIDRLVQIANEAPPLGVETTRPSEAKRPSVKIGIARDSAFGFYYAGDLDALRAAGAELVFIDMLRDARLPAIDGLFIGGGFPETQMEALAANNSMRHQIHHAIETGLPTYAECGGLMYLARSIRWHDRSRDMVGVIPGDIIMHEKPIGRGYVQLRETGQGPWPLLDAAGAPAKINAHEFHYSSLENLPGGLRYAYEVVRGHGIDGKNDGIVHRNLLASYSHLRDVANNNWAARFVNFVHAKRHNESPRAAS